MGNTLPPTPRPPRPTCARCLRPQRTCICRWVVPVDCEVEVLILQHPSESSHAKNTARMLHLSLHRSHLLVGETLDAAAWQLAIRDTRQTVLLYPATALPGHAEVRTASPECLQDTARLRLVVIDATWRKSLKMLHVNPLLQGLPRWGLTEVPSSRYRIRKAHKPGQLSTLEATCTALLQLGAPAEPISSLLNAFDAFVAQQADFSRPQSQQSLEKESR